MAGLHVQVIVAGCVPHLSSAGGRGCGHDMQWRLLIKVVAQPRILLTATIHTILPTVAHVGLLLQARWRARIYHITAL